MSDDELGFETHVRTLRYVPRRNWDEEGERSRWELVGKTPRGYDVTHDGDVDPLRALEIARLVGRGEGVIEVMRKDAAAMKERAARRLEAARVALGKAEAHAVAERREAERLRRVVERLVRS